MTASVGADRDSGLDGLAGLDGLVGLIDETVEPGRPEAPGHLGPAGEWLASIGLSEADRSPGAPGEPGAQTSPGSLDRLLARALAGAADLAAALPEPGGGHTVQLWDALARIAAADLTVARAIEPHLDAVHIMSQARAAGLPAPAETGGCWGVFAAEGPAVRVDARPADRTTPDAKDAKAAGDNGGRQDPQGWTLSGRKPWCSLGGRLERALVTAWVSDRDRGLFAVDLAGPGVRSVDAAWVARGLSAVDSGPLDFDHAPAEPVGPPGWYLQRPGFAWGGIGVAAIWYGGALGVARRLLPKPGGREPDQIAQAHLGACDAVLHAARCALQCAAAQVDAGEATGDAGAMLALRVRTVVAQAAEEVLRRADHGLGPGPLATDEAHARRVADLHLYLRQWHAERDHAALGRAVAQAALGRAVARAAR